MVLVVKVEYSVEPLQVGIQRDQVGSPSTLTGTLERMFSTEDSSANIGRKQPCVLPTRTTKGDSKGFLSKKVVGLGWRWRAVSEKAA